MNGKLLLAIAVFGLAAMGAPKSYTFTLYQTATVGNMELKPGSYKLDLAEQKAVIHNGRQTSEVPVKVETSDWKFAETAVGINQENGKSRVREIRLGGTKTKLVLEESSGAGGGQ
jgi:hypothetical protein